MKLEDIVLAIRKNFKLSGEISEALVLLCDTDMEHSKYMAQEMLVGIASQHGYDYKDINRYMALSFQEYLGRESSFKKHLESAFEKLEKGNLDVDMTQRFHLKYRLVTNFLKHNDTDNVYRSILNNQL